MTSPSPSSTSSASSSPAGGGPVVIGSGSVKPPKGSWLTPVLVVMLLALVAAAFWLGWASKPSTTPNSVQAQVGQVEPIQNTAATQPTPASDNPTVSSGIENTTGGTSGGAADIGGHSGGGRGGEGGSAAVIMEMFKQGLKQIEDGQAIEGRATLSEVLFTSGLDLAPPDAQAIRDTLTSVNRELVFGSKIMANDPIAETYLVQSGDVLIRIAKQYHIPYQLLEQINHTSAKKLRAGQKLKAIKGPLHAIVTKSSYMMDVYALDADSRPLYVCSFAVGLGQEDSTPIGSWIVTGKIANPGYTDPNSRQYITPDDPANPLGEYWIALEGTDELTGKKRGYGIHGTIEPQTIGQQASLGCVRLQADDIAQVYRLLVERQSTVKIQP